MSTCVSILSACVDSPSSLCVRLRVAAFRIRLVRFGTIAGDSDPIRICAHYRPNIQAIRRSIHGMICRSVLVRAVKTRRWFGFETASFHVRVCFCVISLFTIIGMRLHVSLLISCDFLLYFTSLITCIASWDICDCSPYLCSWYELVSTSFHVLVVWRCCLGLELEDLRLWLNLIHWFPGLVIFMHQMYMDLVLGYWDIRFISFHMKLFGFGFSCEKSWTVIWIDLELELI